MSNEVSGSEKNMFRTYDKMTVLCSAWSNGHRRNEHILLSLFLFILQNTKKNRVYVHFLFRKHSFRGVVHVFIQLIQNKSK